MASGVKQYVIRERMPNKTPLEARLKVFVLSFVTFIVIRLAFDRWIFSLAYESRQFEGIVSLLLLPAAMSVWFTWRFPALFHGEGVLIVGDDFVERLTMVGSQTIKTRINRALVQSVCEISRERFGIVRNGVLVKGKGKLVSWLRGYVFVPSSIEDYEAIKANLMSWTESKRQQT